MAPHNLVAVAQRQLFRLILAVATLHGPAVADELENIGVEGGFFLFSEQEASWSQGTLEGARTKRLKGEAASAVCASGPPTPLYSAHCG